MNRLWSLEYITPAMQVLVMMVKLSLRSRILFHNELSLLYKRGNIFLIACFFKIFVYY